MNKLILVIEILSILFIPHFVYAIEKAPRISDKEIIERLTRLEEGQKAILREMDKRFEFMDKRFESIDKRFESMDKRFESIDKRFESMDKRFESIDKRFDQMINIFIAIVASFSAIVAVTIGFAIWDRRTMIRPFEVKVKKIEEDIIKNSDKIHSLLESLRALSKDNKEIAQVLKRFNLL
jgi:septation ring formation regulator EzrA